MKKIVAVIALVLILAGVNWSIMQKENQLATGKIAYLKLRPVDPRSLMQGDYMALRFQLSDDIQKAHDVLEKQNTIPAKDGYFVVTLDNLKRASFKTLYEEGMILADNELKMQYRIRGRTIKLATNAFFFQEGTAKIYEKAKYGQFRVNKHGGLLLAKMADENLNILEALKLNQ